MRSHSDIFCFVIGSKTKKKAMSMRSAPKMIFIGEHHEFHLHPWGDGLLLDNSVCLPIERSLLNEIVKYSADPFTSFESLQLANSIFSIEQDTSLKVKNAVIHEFLIDMMRKNSSPIQQCLKRIDSRLNDDQAHCALVSKTLQVPESLFCWYAKALTAAWYFSLATVQHCKKCCTKQLFFRNWQEILCVHIKKHLIDFLNADPEGLWYTNQEAQECIHKIVCNIGKQHLVRKEMLGKKSFCEYLHDYKDIEDFIKDNIIESKTCEERFVKHLRGELFLGVYTPELFQEFIRFLNAQ